MWRLEKDPYLSSTFGTVMILDRAPDWDAFRRRVDRATIAIPRLRQRVPPRAGEPVAADLGRRPQLRPRPPRPPDRHPEARDDAPGARPRLAVRRRPARAHPPALAVRRGRRHARWQSRGHPEDAPHDHRRRARRRAVVAVPRLRTRRARTGAARTARVGRRRNRCTGRRPDRLAEGVRHRRAAVADRHREAGARAARRPDLDPRRVERGGQDVPWHRHPALRHRRRPLAAVDRAVAAAPHRARPRLVPQHQGRREAARRHAQHRVPHRGRRRRVGVPHRARRAGRVAAGVDGDLHPHRVVGRQRLLARPAARADRRDADRRALPRDPGGDPDGPRDEQDRRPRHDRHRRQRPADLGDHAASPASSHRRSTSRPRT